MIILSINLNHCALAQAHLQVLGDIMGSIPDIICMQEPYAIQDSLAFVSPGWRFAYLDKGRTGILVTRPDIDFTRDLETDTITAISVFNRDSKRLGIITVYFSAAEDIDSHLSNLETILTKYESFILTGDFNSKHTCWGAGVIDSRGRLVCDFIISNNLILYNESDSVATFKSVVGEGWTDLVLSSSDVYTCSGKLEILLDESLSDHRYVRLVYDVDFHIDPKINISRDVSRITRFCKSMHKKVHDFKLELDVCSNSKSLDYCTTKFFEDISRDVEKKLRVGHTNDKNISWWNSHLTCLRRKIRALRKSFQTPGILEDVRLKRKILYKKELAIYKRTIRKTKSDTKRKFFINNVNYYDGFYRIASGKTRPASTFNNPTGISDLKELNRQTITGALKLGCFDSFVFEDERVVNNVEPMITSVEIRCAVNQLRRRSAAGPDFFSPIFVQVFIYTFLDLFLQLFNLCFKFGTFPRCWKLGRVILLPKPNGKLRPIVLLSVFGKVYEKIIVERLRHYLNINAPLSRRQYGFVPGRSTDDALYDVMDFIKTHKKTQHVVLVSLDVSSAFDSVRWRSVLQTLIALKTPRNIVRSYFDYFAGAQDYLQWIWKKRGFD
ncbi:uncharacterized protein LOC118204200 [Stegodyphus dumicola]|uniref:uncharacterized protein LOC118204200 n=1 Tax=Stegodyphus dumicola TaxID=202533 RepID=UPI0015A871FD|nr:uncharacterized protein LOC118204200 [Stegodyphus dumicola]